MGFSPAKHTLTRSIVPRLKINKNNSNEHYARTPGAEGCACTGVGKGTVFQ